MKSIVILVSGSGTNLQRIIEAVEAEEIHNTRIAMVVADRACYGLERAEKAGIPTKLIKRGKDFSENLDQVIAQDTDLIVLAGFLSVLNQDFCEKWTGKIINLHPALLPKYGGKGMWGMHVHRAVKAAGETESGATVHFVTAKVDDGQIILQKSVKLSPEDSPEDIAEKIHPLEYEILPQAIEQVLNNDK